VGARGRNLAVAIVSQMCSFEFLDCWQVQKRKGSRQLARGWCAVRSVPY
jgi:hypothetical protein